MIKTRVKKRKRPATSKRSASSVSTKTIKRKLKPAKSAKSVEPEKLVAESITEQFACPVCRKQFTAMVDESFVTMYAYDRYYRDTLSKFCPRCWTWHTAGRFD